MYKKNYHLSHPGLPGLTSLVISPPPLPTSAAENLNLPIPIPLPSDSRSPPLRSSYGGVLFISRTFSQRSPTRAPGDATRMQSVLDTISKAPVSDEEQETHTGALFLSVSLLCSSLRSFTCITAGPCRIRTPCSTSRLFGK
ncbi:hypothetical protein H4582DRAFT_1351481 [Lactarius indigo]|nr:hypothetical protein H4582DRAFT_1351481 [Lactarius indigo]